MRQLYYDIFKSPIGDMVIVVCETGVVKVDFEPFDLTGLMHDKTKSTIVQVKQWLKGYFNHEVKEIDYNWDLKGTPFQQKVWKALLTIPYGETTTYKAIGQLVKCSGFQAVGHAIGKNPLSILIPCHRVIGSNHKLTGYAGGLDRKQYLLDLEQKKNG